jgi:hypothetical protein
MLWIVPSLIRFVHALFKPSMVLKRKLELEKIFIVWCRIGSTLILPQLLKNGTKTSIKVKKKLNRYLQANADADPDPLFHFYADPDPHPHQSDANLRPLGIRTLDGSVVSLYSS